MKVIDDITKDKLVKSIINSINDNQEKSKEWLIDNSKEYFKFFDNPKICVLAGWYGNLADKLKHFSNEKVRSIDIDATCKKIGSKLYKDIWLTTKDAREISLAKYDIVVCTSCEHFTQEEFDQIYEKINTGSLVIFQSNDYFGIEEHLNCFTSLKDFENSIVLSKLLFSDKLKCSKFTRYMVIGIK